ncbi:MAG: protein TolR [Gammaproteobacteria bacterium]
MIQTGKRRLLSEINVVPYIDVMLVLLIIFMITAPLLTQGINVDLPKASAQPVAADSSEPLVLSIDKDGKFYLNVGDKNDVAIDEAVLVERAAAVIRRNPQVQVLVKADQAVPYGRVVLGGSLLTQAGATKMGLLTDPSGASGKQQRKR